MSKLSNQTIQDLASLATIPADKRSAFGSELQALIDQWDEIALTYPRQQWNPKRVLSDLGTIDNKIRDLRAALGAAGARTEEWMTQLSNGEPRNLAFYDNQLDEMEKHLDRTREALTELKPPPHRAKTGIAGPDSTPSDWFAAEVYAVVGKYGGTLNVNKDGNGAHDYPHGRFHAFLERMKDYLPSGVGAPASSRTLLRIKTEMDEKLQQLALT
jgi:hypothetical protein